MFKKTESPNIKAFELLYDKHSPELLGYIMQNINSKTEAEEILVKVFLKVWDIMKNLEKVDQGKTS